MSEEEESVEKIEEKTEEEEKKGEEEPVKILPRLSRMTMDIEPQEVELPRLSSMSQNDVIEVNKFVVDTKNETIQLKEELKNLQLSLESMEGECVKLRSENKALKEENSKIKAEKFEGNPLLEENSKLKKEIADQNTEIKEISELNDELNAHIDQLVNEKMKNLENEKVLLAKRIEELERDAEAKENQEMSLKNKVDDLQGDLKKLNFRIARTRSARIKSIRYESKRGNVLREFFFTEKTYLGCLEVLKDEYMNDILNRGYLPKKDFKIIFTPLIKILVVNQTFCKKLEKVLFCQTRDEELINLVLKFSQTFKKEYSMYIKAFENLKALFMTYVKKSRKFDKFLSKKHKKLKDPKNREKWDLKEHVDLSIHSLMISPIQRLPRYSLLLRDLLKYTKPDKPHFKKLEEVIETINEINRYCNKQLEDFLADKLSTELGVKVGGKRKVLVHTLPILRATKGNKKKVDSLLYIFSDLIVVKDLKRGIIKAKQVELPVSKEKTTTIVTGEDEDELLIETKGKNVLLIEITKRSKLNKVIGLLKKITQMEDDEEDDKDSDDDGSGVIVN